VKALVPRALVVLGALILLMQFIWWLPKRAALPEQTDAEIYYRAAVRFIAGQPVYQHRPRLGLYQPPTEFFYPPTALAFIAPFGRSTCHAFLLGWFFLMIVALWALAAALAKIVLGRLTVPIALAAGALVSIYPPTSYVLGIGNADLLVLALVAWAFAAPSAAGPLLVAGAAIKLYPAFILIAWWPRISNEGRARTAMAAGALAAWTVLALGPGGLAVQLNDWAHTGWLAMTEAILWWGNFSLSTLVLRPFLDSTARETPGWARSVLTVMPWIVVGGVIGLLRKWPTLSYGAVVLVAAIVCSPICWWWRMALAALVPVALWLKNASEGTGAGFAWRAFKGA
jgi:hypothetical protein